MPPTLVTDRLILRPHTAADFDDCAALWANPDVVRFIGGVPSTRSEVWSRMLRYAGLWPLCGYGYFAVVDRDSGSFIGDAGLANFERAIEPPLGVPESGWVISPPFWGRGIATEAMAAVLAWADSDLDAGETCCIIDLGNAPSVRVADKLGYAPAGTAQLGDDSVTVYRRPRG